MPVEERLALLLDRDSPFLEIAPLAARDMYDGRVHAAGSLSGIGKVSGREVLITANDARIKGGTIYPLGVKKTLRCQTIAMENRLPMVNLVDSGGAFLPRENDAAGTNALSLLLARTMISAAKADGQIDTQESQVILNQINGLDLPVQDKAFLFEEYAKPLDVTALARDVDSPEHAAEVYAASLLMLDPPSPPERIYLETLARELGLDAGLVGEIRATVQSTRAAA